ncbi:hypothetical protein CBL_02808 [Carabus blaptoides fortunei]
MTTIDGMNQIACNILHKVAKEMSLRILRSKTSITGTFKDNNNLQEYLAQYLLTDVPNPSDDSDFEDTSYKTDIDYTNERKRRKREERNAKIQENFKRQQQAETYWSKHKHDPHSIFNYRGVKFEHYSHKFISFVFTPLISAKFKHQAETIKLTLDHVAFGATEQQTRSVKVRTATVKWMGEDADNTNTLHFERISSQYKETQLCLDEVNHCVGIQLLVALAANLFVTVYYLYRFLSSRSNHNVIIDIQQRIHCMVSLASHVVKLILYMCIGQKLKSESRKPIKALQHGKLLRLPTLLREQIQCLILQWLSSEPSGLSAFNVILVGPWLLAPIAGNVITYLLVAIQFQMNTSNSMPANLTAILESVF